MEQQADKGDEVQPDQGLRQALVVLGQLMDSVLMPVSAPETGIVLVSGEQGAVGLGVIGLGAFGRFCLEAYVTMPGIRVVAIADPDADALAAGTTLAPQALAYADPTLLLSTRTALSKMRRACAALQHPD